MKGEITRKNEANLSRIVLSIKKYLARKLAHPTLG